MKNNITVEDISKPSKQLTHIDPAELKPLPAPYNNHDGSPDWKEIKPETREKMEASLDDTCALSLPKVESKEEQEKIIASFLKGLEKLLTQENNWTFLQPLILSLDHCAKCQTCSDACPVFEVTQDEVYRPTFRSEVLRRIYKKHIKPGGKLWSKLSGGDIELNWTTLTRLIELAYRCTLCRRCAQTCPVGVDNGLINHELRKLFSQELGIAAKEIHQLGSVQQLKIGSSTGMNPEVLKDNMEFIDEDMTDLTGFTVNTPFDKEGADILLIHNAGEILAWPQNPGAFAIILEAAGLNWTLSSDLVAYDAVNYGLWYDDAQLARVALKHLQVAKKLGVKKIVVGECGHAHKALMVIADRVATGDLNIPRESCFTLLENIVFSGKLKLDPSKNDFPVTLHDPCNVARAMGVVEPQRRIIRHIAPQFREMYPHGVTNYCCGGGSGFAIMSPNNFEDWRFNVSGRKKFEQIINAFSDCPSPDVKKYLCAPCSNCKGQIRDMFKYYKAWEKFGIKYDGLVELIVNCMEDIKQPFIEWDEVF